MFKLFGTKNLPYELVSPAQASEWIRQNAALVLDVREPFEYAEWHIKEAKLIPLDRLGKQNNTLGAKDRPIIVVCQDGNRSSFAAGQLAGRGFCRVASLKGGLRCWLKAGLTVEI